MGLTALAHGAFATNACGIAARTNEAFDTSACHVDALCVNCCILGSKMHCAKLCCAVLCRVALSHSIAGDVVCWNACNSVSFLANHHIASCAAMFQDLSAANAL